MSDILNDFFKWYTIKEKYKSIISNKLVSSKSEKLKFSLRNSNKIKNNENNNSIAINKENDLRPLRKKENKYLYKKICNNNRKYEHIFLSSNFNKKFVKNKSDNINYEGNNKNTRNKSKINNSLIISGNHNNIIKELKVKNNEIIKKSYSSKSLISLNKGNINEKMIENKVNNIINKLLSQNENNIHNNNSINLSFNIKKPLIAEKFVNTNLKQVPTNKEQYLSFNEQIKNLENKKLRNYINGGINNKLFNLKKYKKIYFDYFSKNNFDNSINKQEIRNIIIGHKINSKFYNKNNFKMKKCVSNYDLGFKMFKKEFINEYNEKKFNYSSKRKYFNKNEYLKFFDNESFNKIASIDVKFKNIFSSLKNNKTIRGKNISKNSQIFKL